MLGLIRKVIGTKNDREIKRIAAIVDRVNAAVAKALADPAVRKGLSGQGAEPVGNSPDEYDRYNRSEIERWTKVARAAGVVPE